jgi:hypothetical protein
LSLPKLVRRMSRTFLFSFVANNAHMTLKTKDEDKQDRPKNTAILKY